MAETVTANSLLVLSDQLAGIVERTAGHVVAVHGGERGPSSGIHWRPGVIVTAEEMLERDEQVSVTLPNGNKVAAALAGRDPSTDIAVLRIEAEGLPVAEIGDADVLRAGNFVLVVGRHDGGPVASSGIVAFAGGAWQSMRGGTIDGLIRLDLALSPRAEGGALVDATGRVLGMAVSGPRRRVLAIPASTIARTVDQLLARGHIARGYLGAGLQRVDLAERGGAAATRGLLVASIDPEGPAARAGLLVGDIVTAWNGAAAPRVRPLMRLLGADSVGTEVALTLLRGGATLKLPLLIGERPLA